MICLKWTNKDDKELMNTKKYWCAPSTSPPDSIPKDGLLMAISKIVVRYGFALHYDEKRKEYRLVNRRVS